MHNQEHVVQEIAANLHMIGSYALLILAVILVYFLLRARAR